MQQLQLSNDTVEEISVMGHVQENIITYNGIYRIHLDAQRVAKVRLVIVFGELESSYAHIDVLDPQHFQWNTLYDYPAFELFLFSMKKSALFDSIHSNISKTLQQDVEVLLKLTQDILL